MGAELLESIASKYSIGFPTFVRCEVRGTVSPRYFSNLFTDRKLLTLGAALLLSFHLAGQTIQTPVPEGAAPGAQGSGAPLAARGASTTRGT